MFVSKFGYIWVIAEQPSSDFHYVLVSLNYKNLKYSQRFWGMITKICGCSILSSPPQRLSSFHAPALWDRASGKEGNSWPRQVAGVPGWRCPFCDCCHHFLVTAPWNNSLPYSIETPRNREKFSFKVGKLFELFSEMSSCLYLCLVPKIAFLFQLVIPSIKGLP